VLQAVPSPRPIPSAFSLLETRIQVSGKHGEDTTQNAQKGGQDGRIAGD
jgi:hypothetical protein